MRILQPAPDERPFTVLTRTFVAQFFASESVTSDIQLRQAMIGILAFLVLPGLFLLAEVFPAYQITGAVAAAHHRPDLLTTALAQICLILVTYSMVSIGLVSVFTWDTLAFRRRDAMVLGPLPIRLPTILAAKLTALCALLLGAAGAVSVMTAIPFALTTAVPFSLGGLIRQTLACLASNLAAALFVLASMVALRGLMTFAGRDRLAARLGSLLQFAFVVVLLCFMAQLESGLKGVRSPAVAAGMQGMVPTAWFLGLFERLLGSTRPDFAILARRALAALVVATTGAVAVSFVGFRRQMQLALARPAASGAAGTARVARTVARLLAGRRAAARATADFTLLTIARNREQQTPIAINAAIGVAIIASALSSRVHSFAGLTHPRTAILWVPLLLAYWLTIGMRAAFFVPADLRAAWPFRAYLPGDSRTIHAGVRASMLAFVVPSALAASLLVTAPLFGLTIVAWHLLLVGLLTVLLVDLVAPTFLRVPFTRPYEPGHAKLKTRWWIYLLGMFAFAWLPVKIELGLLRDPGALAQMAGLLAAAVLAVELLCAWRSRRWVFEWDENEAEDPSDAAVLNLTGLGMRV